MVEGKGERFAISAGAWWTPRRRRRAGFLSPCGVFQAGQRACRLVYLLADGRWISAWWEPPTFPPASVGFGRVVPWSNPRLPNPPEGGTRGGTGELSDVTIRSRRHAYFLAGGS